MNKYEKALASEIGQEPAFTEPVVPKPEGAVVKPEAGVEEVPPESAAEEDLPLPGI